MKKDEVIQELKEALNRTENEEVRRVLEDTLKFLDK